jgi:RNA polymerase sigma factor (sigma-70 family)
MTVEASEDFALFYKDNRGPVFRTLLAGSLNRVAAEDATAEAFARAFVHWRTVATHPNARAWVLRVAWNYHRSSWRRWEGRWVAGLEPARPLSALLVDPDLVAAIGRLPRGQREVLVLKAFGELTPTEIAQLLGKATGTVRGQLSRARATLRQWLGEAPKPEGQDG